MATIAAGSVPSINIQMNSTQRDGSGRSQRRDGRRYRIDCQVSTFGPSASCHGAAVAVAIFFVLFSV
jgi:hypothetical protein